MKKLKRFLTVLGTGFTALTLSACGSTWGSSNESAIASLDNHDNQSIDLGPDMSAFDFSGYRVGVSLADCTSNTYNSSYVQALNEAMSDYGVNASVFDGFGDPGQQSAQIKTLISMEVDLILLWPTNSDSAVSWVQSIQEAGIPVIVANTNVSSEGEQYIEGFIGPSGYDEAYQTAEKMLEDLEETGSIVVLNGPDNYAPVRERRKGLQAAITGTKIDVIEEYDNCGDRSISSTFMTECLKKHSIGEIDAIFCYDDEAALGAFDAMSDLNRTGEMKVYVAASGYYGVLSYIENGDVSAAAIQSPIVDARTTVNYALNYLQGNDLPSFYTYVSTPVATKETVQNLNLTSWSS